jgi:hypothetical protein
MCKNPRRKTGKLESARDDRFADENWLGSLFYS